MMIFGCSLPPLSVLKVVGGCRLEPEAGDEDASDPGAEVGEQRRLEVEAAVVPDPGLGVARVARAGGARDEARGVEMVGGGRQEG